MRGVLFRLRRLAGSASPSSSSVRSPCTMLPKQRLCFTTDSDGNSRLKVFDRELKRKQRDRAAWLMRPQDSFTDAVAENLLDRLEDCKKTFPTALCLGGSLGAIRRLLQGRGAIEKLIMMDTSYDMIKLCKESEQEMGDQNIETSFLVADEEFLPIQESSLDLVISCLGLHWTNDLPGAMIQCKLALKPDGLFLAAILGGETLKSFIPTYLHEIDLAFGMTDPTDLSMLLSVRVGS